jgi:hypothetical protein
MNRKDAKNRLHRVSGKSAMTYHLAEYNVGTMRGALNSAIMSGFVARFDEINAHADRAPGYVWRLAMPEAEAAGIEVIDESLVLINLSVWETIEALHQFTYYSPHVELFRQGADWFEKMMVPILVLWWIPAGHIPTLDEARIKLSHLEQHGATPLAFTFKQRFTVADMLAYQAKPSDS